jgi:hypothetical protein
VILERAHKIDKKKKFLFWGEYSNMVIDSHVMETLLIQKNFYLRGSVRSNIQRRSYIGARGALSPPSPKIFPQKKLFSKKLKLYFLIFLIFLVLPPQFFFFNLAPPFLQAGSATGNIVIDSHVRETLLSIHM